MGNNLKASQTQNEDGSCTLYPVEAGINLPKGEYCYFVGETELFEEKNGY